MSAVVFFAFAGLALVASMAVVLLRNPVHCALSLVVSLVAVAVLFLQQGAQLLAAVQVIVYAGAIVVLFLFVIMLLGVDQAETITEPVRYQRPAALLLGLVVLLEVLVLAGRSWATGAHSVRGSLTGAEAGPDPTNIQRVARTLFTDFLWPFELTAALLVIAVVGSVVLARRSGQPAELVGDDPAVREATRRHHDGNGDGEGEAPTGASADTERAR